MIKDLWNSHLSQKPCEKTEEEVKLTEAALGCQERLLMSFTDEQKVLFEEYSELSNALSAISAEQAFQTGVSFATEYILETLGK